MSLESQLEEILHSIVIRKVDPIENLFKIGTTGFYENPFTEVLAYLLDYRNDFPNKVDFVRLFLEKIPGLSDETREHLSVDLMAKIQYTTSNRKYIDLILQNETNMLVFENKIYHHANNPFAEYERDIAENYPTLKHDFYILSFQAVSDHGKWKNVLIKDIFSHIRKNIKFKNDNKWDHYIQDFLDHYLPKEPEKMTKQETGFYEKTSLQ